MKFEHQNGGHQGSLSTDLKLVQCFYECPAGLRKHNTMRSGLIEAFFQILNQYRMNNAKDCGIAFSGG